MQLDAAVARASQGDPAAASIVTQAVAAAGRDRDALAPVLDGLARSAAGGSPHALELLLAAIDSAGLVRGTVRRLILDERSVQDVEQDVLVAVAESVRRFRGEARFTTWLHQVARNTAITALRRRRDEATLPEEHVGDAQRISSMIATRVSLAALLDELPPAYRHPVVLRDVEQLAYDEIGVRLGLGEATVRSRVARGRALVAARLRARSG